MERAHTKWSVCHRRSQRAEDRGISTCCRTPRHILRPKNMRSTVHLGKVSRHNGSWKTARGTLPKVRTDPGPLKDQLFRFGSQACTRLHCHPHALEGLHMAFVALKFSSGKPKSLIIRLHKPDKSISPRERHIPRLGSANAEAGDGSSCCCPKFAAYRVESFRLSERRICSDQRSDLRCDRTKRKNWTIACHNCQQCSWTTGSGMDLRVNTLFPNGNHRCTASSSPDAVVKITPTEFSRASKCSITLTCCGGGISYRCRGIALVSSDTNSGCWRSGAPRCC